MTRRLAHRGPDGEGIWCSPQAHLGHRRLAILDLSDAGHQPMTLGPYTIVYNGEIYNFRQLRRQLAGPFRSDCDTEVLLHLYREHGDDCVDLLRGMFAFAIWDSDRRRLFAARDRLGIKPFYHWQIGGNLAFASELKGLLELGEPELDRGALRDYFTYKCTPAPKTIYRGISQLPPAHRLVWQAGSLSTSRYWLPSLEDRVTEAGPAREQLTELLAAIVPETTVADVPVAVFLSGGIDSTSLVAHLDRPRTFTLASQVKHRDESAKARAVAEHFGCEHYEEPALAVDLEEAVETIPRVYDEPFADSAAWSLFLISRLARSIAKVALSGEGGDELFLGYDTYHKYFNDRANPLQRLIGTHAPPFLRGARPCQRRAATGLERYSSYISPFTVEQRRALLGPELEIDGYDDLWHMRRFWRHDLHPLKRMQWLDLNTDLPGNLLTKVDRASMAHGLEVRPPLLDHRLVEFALSVHPELHCDVGRGRGKLLPRRVLESRVPPGHFEHAKRGFNLPIARWLEHHPERLRAAFDRLEEAGLVRTPRFAHFTHEQSWTILVLDRWLQHRGKL